MFSSWGILTVTKIQPRTLLVLLKLHFWPGFYPTSFCQSNTFTFLNSLPFMSGWFDLQQPHPDLELWVLSGPMREHSVSRSCKASSVYFCLSYMFCICGEWWKLRLYRNEQERVSWQSDPFGAFTELGEYKTRCRRLWRCLSARKKYLRAHKHCQFTALARPTLCLIMLTASRSIFQKVPPLGKNRFF